MAVMAREAWTDERLDDLNARVERGFDRVDRDIRELRGEISGLRGETREGFESGQRTAESLRESIESVQRTMVIGFVTLFASIAAVVIGGVLAT